MSNILVINCGSSSVKFAIINPKTDETFFSGLAESINSPACRIKFKENGNTKIVELVNGSYADVFSKLKEEIISREYMDTILAIGHRVVHGGRHFSDSVIVDEINLKKIAECIALAPLHNPANIEGIEFCQEIFPGLMNVTVFDTAFHQTIPQHISSYAIPKDIADKYGIRKYGFHGTSHKYVSQKAAEILNIKKGNFISAHLGNGSSICAVVDGKSYDTSMGLTPLDGLVMGTRSGCIDPSVFAFMQDNIGMDIDQISNMLNKKSGLLGICGSSDMREVSARVDQGDKDAILAAEMFCQRVANFVASYLVYFKTFDGLIFTGGIGENGDEIRENVINKLKNVGFDLDLQKNAAGETFINTKNSHNIMVINTNEELMIARETLSLKK